jgi:hypothetical protein
LIIAAVAGEIFISGALGGDLFPFQLPSLRICAPPRISPEVAASVQSTRQMYVRKTDVFLADLER